MRQSSTPNKVILAHRWKQHLRHKPYNAELSSKLYGDSSASKQMKVKTPRMTTIGHFFSKMSLSCKRINKNKIKISLPNDFCIFSNPETVIKLCGQAFSYFRKPHLESIHVRHTGIKKYSLGSEVLFGLSCAEGEKYREHNKLTPIALDGYLPENNDHESIIRDLGVISELNSVSATKVKTEQNPLLVHVFKSECLTHDTPSGLAKDKKNKTTDDVILHLNQCLKDYQLELKEEAAQRFRNCISEMLDNAVEHCKLTHPAWYVRSYLNSNGKDRFFELSIWNFGRSYADSFMKLDKDHFAREFVDKYIKKHRGLFDASSLYTVVALQGRVSSKNTNELDSRGQGTIVLIESFEKMYKELKALRPSIKGNNDSVMNLISGNTIIHFDGKFCSRTIPLDDGGERVIYPINSEQNLGIPPSRKHVLKMNNAYFPGAMINIRLPLTESIVSVA
ncbi:hypothetical protein [Aeromonas hydrophila]|uniref:hypothetical protein n=1 Tax=Aeromonas hydrophila TaxID=644 RepID=UPI0012DB0C6B|nr:hypothetical protein [Aeromonas hydrophila]